MEVLLSVTHCICKLKLCKQHYNFCGNCLQSRRTFTEALLSEYKGLWSTVFECNKNLLNNNLLLVGVTMSVLVGAGFCWLFAMNYCSVIRRCWMIYAMLQCYSQKGAGSFQLIIILSTFPGSTSTKIALVFLIYNLQWSTKIRVNSFLTTSFILHTLQA